MHPLFSGARLSAASGFLSAHVCLAILAVLAGCGTLSEASEVCPDGDTVACLDVHPAEVTNSRNALPEGVTPASIDNLQAPHDTAAHGTGDGPGTDHTGASGEDGAGGEGATENVPGEPPSILPCQRRGVLEAAEAGRVNGVVRVVFSRPENLRTDWRNLIFRLNDAPVPFAVGSDDGDNLELFVYVGALASVRTLWLADSCGSEPDHGPAPDDVWQYQLRPPPAAEHPGAPVPTGFSMDCEEQDTSFTEPQWGCGQLMYRDEDEADAWAIALRSRAGCGDYPIPGNYGHVEQNLNVPDGTYRMQGVMVAKATRYADCGSPLTTQALLAVGDMDAIESAESASSYELNFSGNHACDDETVLEVRLDVEVTLSESSRLRMAVQTDDCTDATSSLSDLRLYRLPEVAVESYEIVHETTD